METPDMEEVRTRSAIKTAMVSVMWANNETGGDFSGLRNCEIGDERGALTHRRGTSRREDRLGSDRPVSICFPFPHKLHAPKGIGALDIKKGNAFFTVDDWRSSGVGQAWRDGKCSGRVGW